MRKLEINISKQKPSLEAVMNSNLVPKSNISYKKKIVDVNFMEKQTVFDNLKPKRKVSYTK